MTTTPNTTASGAADLTPDIECDCLVAWNRSVFGTNQHDTVHPMYLTAFKSGYKAALAASAPVAPTQPASKRLIGWRTPDYLEETADAAMAKNWSVHHDLLPIFEGDVHTKLATPQAAPVAPAPQPAAPQGDGVPTWQAAQDPMLECSIQPRPLSHPLAAYHSAMSKGPLHYTWQDKPHRLVYDLIAAVKHYSSNQAGQAAPAPVAEDAEIRKALDDAATALETISRIAGRDQYMLGMMDVRLYAASRAKVAREALAAQPEGGATA